MINKINKLMRLPEAIPCDKRIHALAGVILASVMLCLNVSWVLVLPIVIVIAWAVEFYQKFTKSGTYDNYDALAVVLGGFFVIIPLLVER